MISLLIILSLFFITFIIIISSIVFKLFSKCGNPFFHYSNITKCCSLKIDNEKWNHNKMISKYNEIKDKNLKDKYVSFVHFTYNGFDMKNIKLIIRIKNNQIKNKNYVLLTNGSHQFWDIGYKTGVLEIYSDNSLFDNRDLDKNLSFVIYPTINLNCDLKFEIFANKLY